MEVLLLLSGCPLIIGGNVLAWSHLLRPDSVPRALAIVGVIGCFVGALLLAHFAISFKQPRDGP
jgi:hypothetical protein